MKTDEKTLAAMRKIRAQPKVWLEHEGYGQCEHHYGEPVFKLRRIQVSHDMSDPANWQAPFWACPDCREHLKGRFRYAPKEA